MPGKTTLRAIPALVICLVVVGNPAFVRSANANEKTDSLPTADEILERSIRATGGRTAWLKLTSMRLKADLTDAAPKGMAGKLEILSKAPDKVSECLSLTSVQYFACRAYDGKTGWSDDSKDGLTALEGPRLAEIKSEAVFYAELNRGSGYASLKVKGEDVFDGVPVYVLAGTRISGRKEELYFSRETGFEVGSKELGQPETNTKTDYYRDYKEIAGFGVKIPTKLRTVNNQADLQIAVYEIVPNPPIADAVFSKPTKSARDAKGAGITDRPDNGRVVDGVYTNEFLGFRYTVPKGWTVHGEETQKVIMEAGKEVMAGEDQTRKRILEAASKRTFQLLTVFEYPLGTPNKPNRGIQVAAENVAFAPGIQTGKDYLQVLEQNIAAGQVHFEFEGEPTEETVDGIVFSHHYGHFQVGGRTIHEVFYATMLKGYAVSFIFSGTSKETVEESAKSVGSLQRVAATTAKP
jgi:hypothetical protein